eukprot:GGOE01021480.1.p1 GENE.GGOE01021480.1~~GGOE01021480.1.p1  ORF type:complete len:1431 (+),score=498.26 GGOE01021480.1:443-4294(+)
MNDAATELSSSTYISQAPTDGPDVLRNFQQYWITHMSQCGPLPTIEIRLENAFATVQALKPREGRRLDNMWTPITRRMHRCLCDVVHSDISIFRDFNAVFRPGEMTLLIGAPGSGKSTLLKLIAGRLADESHWNVGGVLFNGKSVEELRFHPARYVALVDETDLHLPTMTVEETLKFAYCCNCPSCGDVDHVQTIMQILGLSHVAKTVVGDQMLRGCSGGERRRVTVGEAWAANVRVLLADRLTDGLDSQATLDIVRALRVWSHITSATVILALLQPPPEVYKYFDKVCILQRTVTVDGEVSNDPNPLYCGPMRQSAIHMRLMGYEEDSTRPGRRVLPITQIGRCSPEPPSVSEDRVLELDIDAGSPYKRSFFQHLWLLVKRQFRLEFFNRGLFISRILLNTVSGLATASIFQTDENIQSALNIRTSILFHSCMTVVISVVSHIGLFGADRPVFYKQRGAFFFRSFSFWIAHNLFQLVFWGLLETFLLSVTTYWLGGLRKEGWRFVVFWITLYLLNIISSVMFKVLAILCSTVSVAQAWAGLVQVVFFVFSGFLQPWPQLPSAWRWGPYISPQSYAFSIMLINEFSDTTYHCTPQELVRNEGTCPFTKGDDWLKETYDISTEGPSNNIGFNFFVLILWYIAYFLAGGVALHWVRWNRRIMHRLKAHTPESQRHYIAVPPEVVMSWSDVGYSVKTKQATKQLLNNISGIIKPATLMALMGPSGAGKTTLLDVLAGRKTEGTTTGEIRLNGHPKENRAFLRISGYVEQFDSHCTKYTVLESLLFSARMRLGAGIPTQDRQRYCENIAAALHLLPLLRIPVYQLAADQRKYLGVAVELVSNPSVLFLDEPTTGLDGLRAYRLMGDVQTICRRAGISVICTIHQPSAPLFDLFSHLVLLCKGGEVAYVGPTGEGSQVLIAYLQGIPTVSPMKGSSNPAHWMLDEVGGGSQPSPDKQRLIVAHFAASDAQQTLQWELDHYSNPLEEELVFSGRYAATRGQQFAHLLSRASKVYWRSPEYTLVRTVILLIFSVIFGTSFWRMPYDADGMFLRMSFCYTTTFYCGLTYLVSAMTVLMSQRPVFYREKDAGMYSPAMYGLAYMLGEVPYFTLNGAVFVLIIWPLSDLADNFKDVVLHFIPFWLFLCMCTFLGHALAAVSPTNEVAFAVGPGIACWFSALSGFYLSPSSIPAGYMWVYWLNPFQYTFDSMVCNMLAGRVLNCTANYTNGTNPTANNTDLDCILVTSDNFLQFWGLRPSTLWYWMDQLVVVAYIFAWIVGAFLALRFLQFNRR